jgi:hypothetical protein
MILPSMPVCWARPGMANSVRKKRQNGRHMSRRLQPEKNVFPFIILGILNGYGYKKNFPFYDSLFRIQFFLPFFPPPPFFCLPLLPGVPMTTSSIFHIVLKIYIKSLERIQIIMDLK